MHRRIGTAVVATTAALAVSLTAAVSTSTAQRGAARDTTTIKLVAAQYSDKTKGYWENLIKAFEAKNPNVKVDLQVIDWNNITQQVNTMVQTRQLPDILNLNTYAGFAKDGLLYKASDVMAPSTVADFVPTFAKNSKYNGTQYGMPLLASARALFYNKDLFTKAHIAAPPKTWAQLLADAKKLQALGNGTIGYGLPLGAEEAQAEWSIWMWGNGGNWKSGSKWTINSPKNVQTLQYMVDLSNKYKVTESNPGKTNRTDGVWTAFAQGKVGMCMGSPGTFIGMLKKAPKVHYGIAAIPVNAGNKPVTLGVEDYLMAFKKSGNQAAVKAFLAFFYGKTNYAKFLTTEGFLPTTKSGSSALKSNPAFAPYLKLLPSARFYPSDDPAWPKVQGAVQNELGTAFSSSPKSVLDDIQRAAERG
jgi:multiple sugar transport system substrate-binding protein